MQDPNESMTCEGPETGENEDFVGAEEAENSETEEAKFWGKFEIGNSVSSYAEDQERKIIKVNCIC